MIVNHNFGLLHSNGKPHPSSVDFYKYAQYRYEWRERPINFVHGTFPLHLDIDVSPVCNFACPTCSSTMHKKIYDFMHLSTYHSIIDQAVKNGCYGVKYHTVSRGEPLLHPSIVDMVWYAREKGIIDIRMNTNGSILNPKLMNELAAAGLDLLIVSMDGSNEQEYKASGRSGNFKQISDCLAEIKSKKYRTVVRIQSISFPHVDCSRLVDYWKNYADEVAVIGLFDMGNTETGLTTETWHCPDLYQRMSILYDGTILPCTCDVNELLPLGNVDLISLFDAWVSGTMGTLRALHRIHAAEACRMCNECYYRASAIVCLPRLTALYL